MVDLSMKKWHEMTHVQRVKAVAIGIVIGAFIGYVVGHYVVEPIGEKADESAPSLRLVSSHRVPLCDDSTGGCSAHVDNAKDGVHKYKNGRLGAARKDLVGYEHNGNKTVILDALMAKQGRMVAHGRLAQRLSRDEMWHGFKQDDNCLYQITSNTGSGTFPDQARWSCEYGTEHIPRGVDLNSGDVRAMICSGGAAIGIYVIGGFAAGPPGWVGLGTAFVGCMFQGVAEHAADD